MIRTLALTACVAALGLSAAPGRAEEAKNVILFLGDAGGVSTLSAAGILENDRPLSLFIQSMPNIALSDTSALDEWVTDSAAGMTAIVTGRKTNNAMVSALPGAGGQAVPVKSLMEYAEQRGLATGIVTNMPIWDATPAANYAHVARRSDKTEIFRQMLKPRYGDGVDVLIGKGRTDADAAMGGDARKAFAAADYSLGDDLSLVGKPKRAAVLHDADFAPMPALEATLARLAKNPKGYVLVVEWDMHTDDPRAGLRHVGEMDAMVRRAHELAGKDTLILFTADHSFGLRMVGGSRATPLAQQYDPSDKSVITVERNHTGEEVIVAASGPGADKVRGFMPNTRLFDIMLSALGWKRDE
ncbi:MAG: alkaline phosphatase [Novosphingobium pentaromativorans]|uniref:Alkaline phosphatase n=1 Tax=Novosphingobium pentaromativorans TaxID=205844 RepID=A0A2W5P3S0_9SPHN|nr:alkaline phosphatase [Novosphingobium panipatense]PZQ57495.1 MAG: alkaline phosphatase [Novosphingobium pentaromativorans]